jgi:hypothetical protein
LGPGLRIGAQPFRELAGRKRISMAHFGRTPNPSTSSWRAFVVALLIAVSAAALAGVTSAAPVRSAADSGSPTAVAAKTCTAMIQKGSKFVALYEKVYKYKFVKIKGSKGYKRKIVSVKQKMKVSCTSQCVVMVKKKGKLKPVYVYKTKKVRVPKHGVLRTVKKRLRTYKFGKCPASKNTSSLGTPVNIKLLDGSVAHLDFGAFQRDAPVTGSLKGFVVGGIHLGQDFQITLSSGSLALGQTPVFIDDDCDGQVSASIRTGNPTSVQLDKTKTSTSTVLANGSVTATANMLIHLPLELRNDDLGCNSPYITTGYTDWQETFFLKGKLDPKLALSKLKLVSAPDLIDVPSCLSPGVPTSPCNGFVIPISVQLSTELYVAVTLS